MKSKPIPESNGILGRTEIPYDPAVVMRDDEGEDFASHIAVFDECGAVRQRGLNFIQRRDRHSLEGRVFGVHDGNFPESARQFLFLNADGFEVCSGRYGPGLRL
jgi:hypothetical protein